MEIDRARVNAAFDKYVQPYDMDNPKVALKVEHSRKVAELCERIAASEGFSCEFVELAWLAGMLHDIGRFEQLVRYDTFNDAASIPHARLSSQILFRDGLIGSFVDADPLSPEMIDLSLAISTHSHWRLPRDITDCPGPRLDLCNVLRDADKIDILRVIHDFPVEAIYAFTEEELLASPVTPVVVEVFDTKQTVPTRLKHSPADFVLGHCAFGWQLVFPESRKMALEQSYLAMTFDRDWQVPETREVFARAKDAMLEWLADETVGR